MLCQCVYLETWQSIWLQTSSCSVLWIVVTFALIKPDISSVVSVFNVIGFCCRAAGTALSMLRTVLNLLQSQRHLLNTQTAATHFALWVLTRGQLSGFMCRVNSYTFSGSVDLNTHTFGHMSLFLLLLWCFLAVAILWVALLPPSGSIHPWVLSCSIFLLTSAAAFRRLEIAFLSSNMSPYPSRSLTSVLLDQCYIPASLSAPRYFEWVEHRVLQK